jgi:photosystem II stability/assembly factor-like uncharacterized protein
METRTDVEERLRGYAREFDREFPPTTGVERRIIARIAIAPSRSTRASRRAWAWGRAGGLVRELAIVAILLVLAGVLVVGATKLRALQPRTVTPPVTATPPPVGKLTQPPAYWAALHFVSADVGWVAETKTSAGPSTPGPTFIYKTTDGGRTWQQQLTWDGPGPVQVRFSADGSQGLLVGNGGVPLFKTADGGAHWQRMAPPPQATQVALQYFLDAREGWIISYLNQANPGIAGVFHTTDGGQSWTQTASLDVNQDFGYGAGGGSLQGNLMFRDSSTGWLTPTTVSGTGITPVPPFLYMTHDGGRTWGVQTFAVPSGVSLNSSTASFSPPEFFKDREGVVLATLLSNPPDTSHAPTFQGTYAYTTIDGGDHWAAPQLVVIPGGFVTPQTISMIDAKTWMSFSASQVERTTDGGLHWEILAGALPANVYPTEVEFQDVSHGWAAVIISTAQPTLAFYQTSDGGAHWTALTAPPLGTATGG